MKSFFAFLVLTLLAVPAAFGYSNEIKSAEVNHYVKRMSCDYARGFYNVSRSPLEIYHAQKEYEGQQKGRPVVRNIAGFVDGTFKCLERMGSGVWDFFAGLLPGEQQGVPPNPEVISIGR
jgi:hypothetical protein